MVRKPNASKRHCKTIRRVMEEYDVESILDMYEDDYVPESRPMMAGGGQNTVLLMGNA